MPEQVFELEPLTKRAVAFLQQRGDWVPTGSIALELKVPLYAADAALERAYLASQAEFCAGAGWRALEAPQALPSTAPQQGLDLAGDDAS